MGPLCTFVIFSLTVVLSIRAAPLPEDPVVDTTLPTATDIPEVISSPISIISDLFLGENTSKPAELLLIPSPPTTSSSIISQYQETSLDGKYEFGYVSSNGIEVEEKGAQKEIVGADGEKASGTVSSGKYSYLIVDNDGKTKRMTVTWTADEKGFRPVITISDA